MTAEQLSRVIGRTAARLGRQVDAALATVELSSAQYRLLFQLADGAEASTTLARKLEVSAPSVTAVVDGLVNRGLIERSHSALDRRRVSLNLTDEGRRVLTEADASVTERLTSIATHLDPVRAAKLIEDLPLWDAAFDARRHERLAKRAAREIEQS